MTTVNPTTPDVVPRPSDDPWLADLTDNGAAGQESLRRLRELLLRAARHQVWRLRDLLPGAGAGELEDLAQQAADDALIAVLRQLATFQGRSRFTTWAYKFALLEAGVRLRRRAWQEREVVLEPEAWPQMTDAGQSPPQEAETRELMQALSSSIDGCLTDHQREVLVALALNGVPLDVLAERLNTTRGALYKTLHDARRKLRSDLARRGFSLEGIGGD